MAAAPGASDDSARHGWPPKTKLYHASIAVLQPMTYVPTKHIFLSLVSLSSPPYSLAPRGKSGPRQRPSLVAMKASLALGPASSAPRPTRVATAGPACATPIPEERLADVPRTAILNPGVWQYGRSADRPNGHSSLQVQLGLGLKPRKRVIGLSYALPQPVPLLLAYHPRNESSSPVRSQNYQHFALGMQLIMHTRAGTIA